MYIYLVCTRPALALAACTLGRTRKICAKHAQALCYIPNTVDPHTRPPTSPSSPFPQSREREEQVDRVARATNDDDDAAGDAHEMQQRGIVARAPRPAQTHRYYTQI